MRISLNWLKEYVDIPVALEELVHRMTMLGLEVESVERPGSGVQDVVVGKILSISPHPNADKLVVCKTDVGRREPLQIICGASNMKEGDLVPTALVGSSLPGGIKVGQRKMRGIESFGMMCSARELGLGEDHAGLMILDPSLPIGEDIRPFLGLDDAIIEVEITPNRGDWASMIGIARELAAAFHVTCRIPDISFTETAEKASDLASIAIQSPDLCHRYVGRVLLNLKTGPSPTWLARRLLAGGLRPINNIVDITNYVLLETGHPLHAFDLDRLIQHRIIVRNAAPAERITTIDGQDRVLTSEMLVIADAEKPVAIAGVMGGTNSEVGETTRRILLESAYFDPKSVRRTSRALGLQTEASARFQRGADVEMAVYAANRASALMQQITGAQVATGLLDEYPRRSKPAEIRLRYARANAVLGADVTHKTQQDILTRLGFSVTDSSGSGCTVQSPPWRHDVSIEVDLIEEIARLHGYENIAASLPSVRQSEEVIASPEKRLHACRTFLVGQGLTEVITWTFAGSADISKTGLDQSYSDMVAIANPLSDQYACMRTTLIPNLLRVVSSNLKHGALDLSLFEIGPVYYPNCDNELPVQLWRLGIALTGRRGTRHWSTPQEPYDFYDLKGVVEAVCAHFGTVCGFDPIAAGPYQEGASAQLFCKDYKAIGNMGLVRPSILAGFGIKQPVYLGEIFLDELIRTPQPPHRLAPMPTFPPSLRDLAVVVDREVPAGALCEAAREAGGALLRQAEVFDLYQGNQVPPGKKSVALNLVFQSPERTLTDAEVQSMWDRILAKMKAAFAAELR